MMGRGGAPREHQGFLFAIHHVKTRPRPVPKIDEDQATEIISRGWRLPDGSPIPEERARSWAGTFLLHMRYEPGGIVPKLRKRPERPTAERLDRFTSLETDWIKA